MAEPSELNSIIQEVLDARVDMQTFEEFMNAAKEVIISRRLADDVNSLDYYLEYFNALQAVFTQETGSVTVGAKTVKSINQFMADALVVMANNGSRVPYSTYAALNAAKATLSTKTIYEVTNDTEVLNGVYTYNGTALVKATASSKASSGTFDTFAELQTKNLPDDSFALVANDSDLTKNGHYKKVSGVWSKVKYEAIKTSDIKIGYAGGSLIGPETPKYEDLGLGTTGLIERRDYHGSVVLKVTSEEELYLKNTRAAYSGYYAFFANDPNVDITQSAVAHTPKTIIDEVSGITYQKTTVPQTAKYLLMVTRESRVTPKLQEWAVHKNVFSPSYETGEKAITDINGIGFSDGDTLLKTKNYVDNTLLEFSKNYEKLAKSTKNIYIKDFVVFAKRVITTGLFAAQTPEAAVGVVPVENNNYYTVSGLNSNLYDRNAAAVGLSSNMGFVKSLGKIVGNSTTVNIDDPNIAYLAFTITQDNTATKEQALDLLIQVEKDQVATTYEPAFFNPSTKELIESTKSDLIDLINTKQDTKNNIVLRTEFTELSTVRTDEVSQLGNLEKRLAATGITYSLKGDEANTKKNLSNTLYAQAQGVGIGKKTIRANVNKLINGSSTKGVLTATPFTVPSGQFDNPNTLSTANKYSLSGFVHPSIAYDSIGVGGFKYWMIASTLPATGSGGVTWEDEDMFVSNDAKDWQRIRSLYEDEKTYTTTTLRLPPQSLARADSRQNAVLPIPAKGDTIEMSMPISNGKPAVDRQMILLNGNKTPFKHDPAILIDGGFVYIYLTYHVPYAERDGGTNKFIVCVRTSNGIDWDVVRTDGSTMRLTEESSRTIFTKDAQGRYNYIFYGSGGSNPEVIKYGDNDYEFLYGSNFSLKYKGTTPYTFDFSISSSIVWPGGGNHPGAFLDGDTLYLINNTDVFTSKDRGATCTKLPYYPMWLGGVAGIPYKKALCKGDGGKLILVEAQRYELQNANSLSTGQVVQTNRDHQLILYEYPSVADFVAKSMSPIVDAYVDIQLCKVNLTTGDREFIAVPGVTNLEPTYGVNQPVSIVDVANMNFKEGDTLFVFVTLNSRHPTAEIVFAGIDII